MRLVTLEVDLSLEAQPPLPGPPSSHCYKEGRDISMAWFYQGHLGLT